MQLLNGGARVGGIGGPRTLPAATTPGVVTTLPVVTAIPLSPPAQFRPPIFLGPPVPAPVIPGTTTTGDDTTTAPPGSGVTTGASGGNAMAGVTDLFDGLGNFFSNLTHPGTSPASGESAPGAPTSAPAGGQLVLFGIVAVILVLAFRKP